MNENSQQEKIKCLECNKTFKQLSNSHLKSHNLTPEEYKLKHNVEKLSSQKSIDNMKKRAIESNKHRKGIKRSKEICENIKNSIRRTFDEGRIIHNKGIPMKEDQKLILKEKALERNKIWRENNNNPLTGHDVSDETKEKISKTLVEFWKNNPDVIEQNKIKQKESYIRNGTYKKIRDNFLKRKIKLLESFDFNVISIENDMFSIKCNKCNHEHYRHIKSIIHKNICPSCKKVGTSSYEHEIYDFLKENNISNIILNDRTLLKTHELDLYLPDYNIAIEIDGLYWHSETVGKDKNYHINKTQMCNKLGIRLIHIFEDEWVNKKDIVKQKIKNILHISTNERVYARKCTIKEISNSEVKEFFNNNHIQGHVNSKINIGLLYNNEIVSVMSFSKPSIAKGKANYNFELTRYATSKNVIGGAGKSFSYFIKNYNPLSIISYCDLRWGTGNMYSKIGFNYIGDTKPNYWYTKGFNRYHRYNFTKYKLVEQGYDINKTEKEIMSDLKYNIIWDCGHSKWEWKI